MVAVWSGDPQSALTALDAARRLYAQFGDYPLGEQHVLAQRASALSEMGLYDDAMAALDTALVLARLHGMGDQEAENHRLLGSIFADLGDHRRAFSTTKTPRTTARRWDWIQSWAISPDSPPSRIDPWAPLTVPSESGEAALAAHRASGEPIEELDDLLVIADVRQRMGHTEDQEAALRSARLISEQLGAGSARTTVALAEARHAEAAGAHRRVLAAAGRARDASLEADYRTRTEIHGLTARAYAGLGRLDSAAVEGLAAVRALDRVRNDLQSSALRGSLGSASAQLYGDVVLILLQDGRSEEAFAVADGARSRELLHRLSMFAAPPDEDPSFADPVVVSQDLAAAELLLRRIEALLAQLRDLESTPPEERGPGSAATSGEVLLRIQRLRDEYEALMIRTAGLRDRSVDLFGGRSADGARVRAALAPDEALLHYTVTRDQLILFVARRSAIATVSVPIAAGDLASRIRLVRALMGSREAMADLGLPAAKALHELLVGSAADTGLLEGADRLVIVPHGVIEQLPFALLHDPATGRFLIEDYVLSYVPSASAIPALRDERRTPRESLLVSGFAPFPDQLPGTEREAIVAQQAASEGRLYREHEATEAAVRRALAEGGVVHIASHGVLNARNPLFSRIELAPGSGTASDDDGRLEVHEVLAMDVRSPLVVLSGCETALAEDWSGNPLRPAGVATLSQAFLQAGAMNVLATLWRIDDVGSAELVRRLYDAEPSEDVAAALARAQRHMIGHARYGAPYYWAGYIVAASWDRDGVADTLIAVSSVTFVSENELVASIRIARETDIGLYDVAVTRKRKKGVGSEVRAVAPDVFEVIKAESLDAWGFDFASAFSVNDAGTIVGAAVSPHVAGLWSSGQSIVFGTRPSVALGINSDGYIVGGRGKPSNCSMYNDCTWTAYVYHPDTGLTDLQPFVAEGSTEAVAINDLGTVVGWGARQEGGDRRPVVWQRNGDGGYGAAVELPLPHENGFGSATAINERGDIIGTTNTYPERAILWTIRDDGSYENPVLLGGSYASRANGINADGWVVGATSSGGAALWLPSDYSTPIYLDEAGSGVAASEALAISDAGHIVGWREWDDQESYTGMCCEYWGQGALWRINESGVVIERYRLPATSGHDRSTARSVNRHGLMVGYSWVGGEGFSYREATLWRTNE
jgi:uncharacterized membrane protein/tetratricopeptide (TPR) repeat protein